MADERSQTEEYVLEMEVESPFHAAQVEAMKQMVLGGHRPGVDLTLDGREGVVPPMEMLLGDKDGGKIWSKKFSAVHLRHAIQTLLHSVDKSDFNDADGPDELKVEAHIKAGAGVKALFAANTEGGIKVTMTWKKK